MYVNSGRGSSLISIDLKKFLHSRGIATSRTTPYSPQGNCKPERYNGAIWKTISIEFKGHKLPTTD